MSPHQMNETNKLHKAEQARHILGEELVGDVLSGMRQDALEALAKAPVDEPNLILRLQAKVSVIDDFCDSFEAFILDADELGQGDVLP